MGVVDTSSSLQSIGVMCTYYGKSCAVPPALKSGNSFVRASHWLLTQTDFRRSEDGACFHAAVKIATVVAARRRGGSEAGRLGSAAAWAGVA